MNCIGLDVHQERTFGSVVRAGEEVFRFEVATQERALLEVIGQIPGPKRIVVEEGNLSDWCKRTLEQSVQEVIICDPRWNRLISEADDKMDQVDAYRLGLLLWMGQLRAVYHADLQMQQLKEVVISYWQASGDVTRAKNRLRSQLARRGVRMGSSRLYREKGYRLARQQLAECWPQTTIADSLFEQVRFFRQQQAQRLQHLRQQQRGHRAVLRQLQTIPGVGPIVAVTFLAMIADPWRFCNRRQLWKYCGLAVKQVQSGGRTKGRGRRCQQYNRRFKHVLGIAAMAAWRCQDGNRLSQKAQTLRQEGKPASVIRRTLSRQIAVIAWTILKDPQPYRKEVGRHH